MMISAVLFTALRGLVNNRAYMGTFLQPDGSLPEWPAICSTIYNVELDGDICGDGGRATATSHVQVEVVAKNYAVMAALQDQVLAALENVSPPARCENIIELVDSTTKTQRAILEYSFHPSSKT